MVMTSFPNPETASQIGTQLVKSQLAACVKAIPGATSIYRWKGVVKTESETIGLIKTTSAQLEELESWLQDHHPYDEPEIIVVDVAAGSAGYLDWVRGQVSG